MLEEVRVERREVGERRQRVDVDGEVVDAEAERGDPRGVLALLEELRVLGVGHGPGAPGPREICARPEAGGELREEVRDQGLRGGRHLGEDELADEHLRQAWLGVPPVAGDEMFVGERVDVVGHHPARRLERARELRDVDARCAVGAKGDVVVLDHLAARREQAVDALGLRREGHVVAPQGVEQLGGCHEERIPQGRTKG